MCAYSFLATHTKSHPTVRQALLPKAPQCQQALPKPSPTHTDVHALPLMHSLSANPRARYCVLKSRSLAGDKNPPTPQKSLQQSSLTITSPPLSAEDKAGRLEVQSSTCSKRSKPSENRPPDSEPVIDYKCNRGPVTSEWPRGWGDSGLGALLWANRWVCVALKSFCQQKQSIMWLQEIDKHAEVDFNPFCYCKWNTTGLVFVIRILSHVSH